MRGCAGLINMRYMLCAASDSLSVSGSRSTGYSPQQSTPTSSPSSSPCLGACCGRWQASCGSFIKICKQFRSIKTLEIIQRQVTVQPRPLICTHTQTKMIFTRNFSIIFATFETLEYFAIFNGQCKWEKGSERRGRGGAALLQLSGEARQQEK